MDSLGDIWKIIYLGFEKSQHSVTHDSLRYINILTYLRPAGDHVLSIVADDHDVWDCSAAVCHVPWHFVVQTPEDCHAELVPDWSVTCRSCVSHTGACRWQDLLQCSAPVVVCHRPGWSDKYHIGVIHSGRDKSMNKCHYRPHHPVTIKRVEVGKARRNMLHRHWNNVCPSCSRTTISRLAREHGSVPRQHQNQSAWFQKHKIRNDIRIIE